MGVPFFVHHMGVKIFSPGVYQIEKCSLMCIKPYACVVSLIEVMEVTGRQGSIRTITLEEDILHIVDQTPSFGAVKCSSPKTILTNIFFYTKRDYTVTSSKNSLAAGVRPSVIIIWDTDKYICVKYIFTVVFCQNDKIFHFPSRASSSVTPFSSALFL
ncbi:hypothetical protein CEXT_9271 [Caerostris extrusa]|uniref:Uncharacterized protein n=1 Tax=Caerostris extrusa TaxID=172846 RepID=A0AAV4WA50_CAEEX|nr:hypothetical protein CEXT_9271 [Caerostris extrusa]